MLGDLPHETIHCKKRLAVFPSPAGMSLTKLSLADITLIIPAKESLVSDIPAGNGQTANLFSQCRHSRSINNISILFIGAVFPCFPPTCTANEGPVRIQYKCLVLIYVFPEMKLLFPKQNYTGLSPSSYTQISVRDFIYFLDRSAYSAAGKYSMWIDPGNI